MHDIDIKSTEVKDKVNILKLLAHPIRYAITVSLYENGEMNVGAIQDALQLPQSTVSQHISKLREMRIVQASRVGTKIYYKLTNPVAIKVLEAIK